MKPYTDMPSSIKLSQIDQQWWPYGARQLPNGKVHVKSDVEGGHYTLCGRSQRLTRVHNPITCKACIRLLVKYGRINKENTYDGEG